MGARLRRAKKLAHARDNFCLGVQVQGRERIVQDQQCTVLLFSHRLLAFPQADLVVVLDRGRILEQGTHAELSTGNGLYARIYRAQRLASIG